MTKEKSMDPRTGEIYQIRDDLELKAIESRIGRKLVPLDEAQAKELAPLSKRRRKALLNGMACPCGSGKSFKKCCWKRYQRIKQK